MVQAPDKFYLIGEMFIPGMTVVFLALIILIFCVWLMGKVLGSTSKKETPAPPSAPQKTEAATVTAAPVAPPIPAPPVLATISESEPAGVAGETIAVISAAIASAMESGGACAPYAITGVTPMGAVVAAPAAILPAAAAVPTRQRPVWGFAGMQQNTRPF